MAASDEPCCKPMFWVYFLICVLLVLFAGLMSGLTLGLMSLSLVDLEVLAKAGKPQDKKNAAKILPVVKNQHLLLCTLLLGNSLAMEALPIFLDALVPAWVAIVISVTLILAFGEIIPQAVCSRYGLKVGAKLAVVVRILLWVFFPITYPISMLLDCLLGKGHFALLRRAELKTLVDMHGNEAGKGGELTHDETTIISGALDLTQKTAKDVMTPISEAFSLDINSKLDMHRMELIITAGHSRVPIHAGNPTNIIGLILVKNLLSYRPEDEAPIRNLTIREIQRVRDDKPLYEVLNLFQSSRSHMAVVVKPTTGNGEIFGNEKFNRMNENSKGNGDTCISITSVGEVRKVANRRGPQHSAIDANLGHPASPNEEVIGIITMEDVIEELLQEEILDETDEYVEVHSKLRVNMVPQRKLSPRSPGTTILSHHQRRSPLASPLAPYHHSPKIMSPSSPSMQGPPLGQSPTTYSSPIKSTPSSPAQSMQFPPRSSPTSHRVSRKPYEKLTKSTDAT